MARVARSRLRRAVLAASLVCGVCCIGVSASAGASRQTSARKTAAVPPGFVGVNLNSPLFPTGGPGLEQQLRTMVKTGVQTVRVVFDWATAQPYATWSAVPSEERSQFVDAEGVPTRFDQFDRLVGMASALGLRVFPTVMYAPSWDAEPTPQFGLPSPRQTAPYGAFCTALVRRYGPHGSFWRTKSRAVPIRMWDIWNEPSLSYYWSKQPWASSYVALLHAAHRAVHTVDPSGQVMIGGLTNDSWNALQQIYSIHGAGRWFDGVAVHPYTKDPSGVITILKYVRQVLTQHGGAGKWLVADEFSWPSSKGKGRNPWRLDIATTEAGQAKKVGAILPLLAKSRASLHLAGFDYYTWAGTDKRGGLLWDFAGLYHDAGGGRFIAKPAAAAFRKAALTIEHCRQPGRTALACR